MAGPPRSLRSCSPSAAGLATPAPGRPGARIASPPTPAGCRGPGEGIAAAIFDVDGVLTDGRIYIGDDGETVQGVLDARRPRPEAARAGGIVPIVVTGRDSPAVRRRVADLGIAHAAYGAADKLAAAEALLAALGLDWDRVAAMGDDWPDLPLLRPRRVRLRAAATRTSRCARSPHHVTAAAAGHGAAREFCDLLLVAAGRYAGLLRGPLFALDGARLTSRSRPKRRPSTTTMPSTSASPGRSRSPRAPWPLRLLDLVSAYLPLLLMALLGLGDLVAGAQRAVGRGADAPPRRRATSPTTR